MKRRNSCCDTDELDHGIFPKFQGRSTLDSVFKWMLRPFQPILKSDLELTAW